jgi:hypothetical protein
MIGHKNEGTNHVVMMAPRRRHGRRGSELADMVFWCMKREGKGT